MIDQSYKENTVSTTKELNAEESVFFNQAYRIYFDGTKDSTIVLQKGISNKTYITTKLQEHYVIVGEPYKFYLAHVSPQNEKGLTNAYRVENKLKFVGCDGTASMTRRTNGCIANLEKC